MNVPTDIKYTKDHEWIKMQDNNIAIVGITDFAQSELGDIVYVDITITGQQLNEGDVFGTVEAVKTVSDLLLPLSGKIVEVNAALEKNPELVNTDPYGKGWMIKMEISNSGNPEKLMNAEAYNQLIA